jgi:hypothetical protein
MHHTLLFLDLFDTQTVPGRSRGTRSPVWDVPPDYIMMTSQRVIKPKLSALHPRRGDPVLEDYDLIYKVHCLEYLVYVNRPLEYGAHSWCFRWSSICSQFSRDLSPVSLLEIEFGNAVEQYSDLSLFIPPPDPPLPRHPADMRSGIIRSYFRLTGLWPSCLYRSDEWGINWPSPFKITHPKTIYYPSIA